VEPHLASLGLEAEAKSIHRAVVTRVAADGEHYAELSDGSGTSVVCDVLEAAAPPRYHSGDVVLVWVPPRSSSRPVILGRLSRRPLTAPAAKESEIPDELVIEAKDSLTLRVGDGSITLRADGKILIKGKDLVSHAQRLNRIKGGAVSIN
jgi:hypothetical protein